MKKVYCEDCKWNYDTQFCRANSEADYYSKKGVSLEKAELINSSNCCIYFKRKSFWKRWFR